MKRIRANHDDKDRIICTSEGRKHRFYYQPVGTRERFWLFDTKRLSPSVHSFFRKHGRSLSDVVFSITLKEMYQLGNNHSAKIAKVFDRIPAQVEYLLRESEDLIQMPYIDEKYHCHKYDRAV